MPKNTLPNGRQRTSDEQLMTAALMAELDMERDRRGMDQRSFADFLSVHESLLSLYRSGNRLPSLTGLMIGFEHRIPGITMRFVQSYYQAVRRRDLEERLLEQDNVPDTETVDDDLPMSVVA